MLTDNHGRPLSYLRLAVTDRCNLRCFYCMPEEGIHYLPRHELLSYDEIIRLVSILATMGISKIRITGGEPFVRPDLMEILRSVTKIKGVNEVHITTNGILTSQHVDELRQLGIKSVNLSLDTLDPQRYKMITRRDEYGKTYDTLLKLIDAGIPVKINSVVMEGRNVEDIIPMIGLTKDQDVSVRFIEEMPFNGEGSHYPKLNWTYKKILEHIRSEWPDLEKLPDPPHATATSYKVPGYRGSIGIIAAFSRTFCGSCNRIRLTAQGMLKTCLYDDGVLDVKALLRSGTDDEQVKKGLMAAFQSRPKDGLEAEQHRKNKVQESMSTIGG